MLRTHPIFIFLAGLGLVLIGLHESHAQNAIGGGPALKLYQQHCAVCHGPKFNEGLGGSLLEEWDHVTPEQSVDSIIKNGLEGLDMNGFDAVLSDKGIRSIAILIEEKRLQARNAKLRIPEGENPVFETQHHRFSLQNIVEPPTSIFWGMDFLPDGRILVTVFDGQLHIYENGKLSPPVEGTPNVWRRGQGGLMDVGVHPDYEENGWIYLSHAEKLGTENGKESGFTTVIRGKIVDHKWVEEEVLFRVDPESGAIWETEHGPRGGDEVNVIKPGVNYGWPVITYGMNYNGTPITGETEREGMAQPALHFTPSIAICGMEFYTGSQFPKWNNHLFVGGLASQEVWRLVTEGDQITDKELILKGRGRVRDVGCGPDGTLYLILNDGKRSGPGGLYKLVPEEG